MVSGDEIRRVRVALGEHQALFGARFEVTRRTVIRWEKAGNDFSEWGGWSRPDRKTSADLWRDTVKAAKDMQSTKKAATVKRLRGSATRRRSVVKGKARRAKK